MAESEVSVANSALVKIAEKRITSFDEASRKAARTCKEQYPKMRDQLLRSYNWTFAMERATLGPEASAPEFGFSYKFKVPADMARFVGLYDETEPQQNYTTTAIPHKLEGGFLLLDDDVARIFYVRRVEDPQEFDDMFSEALAWLLAYNIAFDLTSDANKEAAAKKGFEDAVRAARFASAISAGSQEIAQASDWLDSRQAAYYGSPWRAGPIV